MYEMVPADSGGISVPHNRDYLERWIAQFYPGGKGECSAVGGMQSIEVNICCQSSGTPYPRNKDDIVLTIPAAINGSD
jgi:hypothetical protein